MNDKTQAALERLESGIQELLDSGDWTRYLSLQAKLHRYSFRNTLLIMTQCPEATQVMGFRQWQKLGRQVKKGEKGIAIFAPCRYKRKEEDGEEQEFLGGFKIAYVFDISQTEGEAIPQPCRGLQGDDAGLLERLVSYAQSQSIQVEVKPLLNCNGFCQFTEQKASLIAISSDLAFLHQAKTMAHELGHALLHGETDYLAHRPTCELEAESVAFIVLDYFGLDTSDYSFGYIARWQEEDSIKTLKQSGQAIQKAAAQIIDALGGE
jgi:antirestriction protein ArdC